MEININNLLTLDDDNEYVVVKKIKYENKYYYYIADINNCSNLKFCYLDNEELVEINDSSLIKKILPLFARQ